MIFYQLKYIILERIYLHAFHLLELPEDSRRELYNYYRAKVYLVKNSTSYFSLIILGMFYRKLNRYAYILVPMTCLSSCNCQLSPITRIIILGSYTFPRILYTCILDRYARKETHSHLFTGHYGKTSPTHLTFQKRKTISENKLKNVTANTN